MEYSSERWIHGFKQYSSETEIHGESNVQNTAQTERSMMRAMYGVPLRDTYTTVLNQVISPKPEGCQIYLNIVTVLWPS